MEFLRGRYSWLLRPLLIVFDITIINLFSYFLLDFNQEELFFFSNRFFNNKFFIFGIYSVLFWGITAQMVKFYRVYRYTSLLNILSLLIKQFFLFSLVVFAFIGVFRSVNIQVFIILKYLQLCFMAVGLMKILSFYALKGYRSYLKGNIRNVVFVGKGKGIDELKNIFINSKELGYRIRAIFSDPIEEGITGSINDGYKFISINKKIDEIYCAIDVLSEKQINAFVKLANLNHCNIKFVPNRLELTTKRLTMDYYGYFPVLSIQEPHINDELNKFFKRFFDIIFSALVVIFILPWVSVILFIIIKIESKGKLIYKHKRNGINYKEFTCYKFRSLKTVEGIDGTYVKKGDKRLTRIGGFLRKTSIDELPQFINVLKGDMSIVGPRPHMPSYTEAYSKKIGKYNFIYRHNVKPGITGLAQIKGYRGEVEHDKDIINRIKYDIFYIENWNILLDIKIIFQTLLNMVRGDDKAY